MGVYLDLCERPRQIARLCWPSSTGLAVYVEREREQDRLLQAKLQIKFHGLNSAVDSSGFACRVTGDVNFAKRITRVSTSCLKSGEALDQECIPK